MTTDFLIGLALLPGAAIAFLLLWLLAGLSRKVWVSVDRALLHRITISPDRVSIFSEEPEQPQYTKAANVLRDALLRSPKLFMLSGLGWRIIILRDVSSQRSADKSRSGADD